MLKLGRKVEYALMSIIHISDLEADTIVCSREISDAYKIPPEVLCKVLQCLTKAEIITSIQGIKGGYKLEHSVDDITIGQVIDVIEGPLSITPCNCGDCARAASCNIKNPVLEFQDQLQDFVYSIPLSSFKNKQPLAEGVI